MIGRNPDVFNQLFGTFFFFLIFTVAVQRKESELNHFETIPNLNRPSLITPITNYTYLIPKIILELLLS